MEDLNFRKVMQKPMYLVQKECLQPSPVEKIPDGPTTS
jgi:hypothetical protein